MRLQIEMKVDSLDIYCMHVCLKVDRVSLRRVQYVTCIKGLIVETSQSWLYDKRVNEYLNEIVFLLFRVDFYRPRLWLILFS
jgi:hypothetical protein